MIIIPNNITKPARYTGIEMNRIMKDADSVHIRFALCYPDIYEIGMSYYGYFLLYELSNTVEGVWCERCFAPWYDMDCYLRDNGQSLATLESKTPLNLMDIVGFSLSYELNVTNVINMLKLGGIKIKAEDRTGGPIVIGGGPLMLNPEPFEKLFDLVVIGEADEVILKILEIMKGLKGLDRAGVIRELSGLEGVYSPLYKKNRVKRLCIKDLDTAYHAIKPPVPVVGSIHNRLNIEISRGCGNGCRFCLAGFGYRPYRERCLDRLKEIIDYAVNNTGYEEISFLSLSSGDYSSLLDAILYVKNNHKGISVSLPSLKIGSINEEAINAIGDIARTGFTFALEAASPELRCRINKNIDVDALFSQLPLLRKHGWKRLKLYFMIGFPWEKEEDVEVIKEIVNYFEKADVSVNLSVSPFIPKPHTPFQWLPMEGRDILREKMLSIKGSLRKKNVRVKYRDIETSLIEAVISRGDNKLMPLFEFLADNNVRLEAWGEFFRPDLYHEWSDRVGVDLNAYISRRMPDDYLPWDFIDNGVDRVFLKNELHRAENMEYSEDCYSGCEVCGIGCDRGCSAFSVQRSAFELQTEELNGKIEAGRQEPENSLYSENVEYENLNSKFKITQKITFRYAKYANARYIGHIDTMNILLRALRSSGVMLKMHGKYHPLPKIAMSEAIPVGIESLCEFIEIETDQDVAYLEELPKRINARLPAGIKILETIVGRLKDVVKEYSYILVSDCVNENKEIAKWRTNTKRHFYTWKGKGIKELWRTGTFKRILKVEDRRINGIRTDNQCNV